MKFSDRNSIIQLTPQWKGERFADGRPKVPPEILRKLEHLTMEEAWKPVWLKGYEFQFEGRLKRIHSNKKLIGRAVTAVFGPARPDLHETTFDYGHNSEHRKGNYNQWVIDSLVEDDVAVIDMFDKICKGTFLGGNLTTAVKKRTKNGGAVIWGGIRDAEQMEQIDTQVYYRGIDVTPIREYLMLSMNEPCRIGNAICLPGDIVYGTASGVLFIPSHLAEEVVENAEKMHIRDEFAFMLLSSGRATTAQIDRAVWGMELLAPLLEFIRTSPQGKEYRHLSWDKELEAAKSADAQNPLETA